MRSMMRSALVCLTGAVSAMGCGGPSAVTDTSGDPIAVDVAEVRVLGTSEALAQVRAMDLLANGRIWVLNSVEPFFVAFGPDGDVLSEWGPRGEGPEEFRAPVALVEGGVDGEAWAYDQVRHSLIRVSDPEQGWMEWRLSRQALSPGSILSTSVVPGDNRPRLSSFGEEVLFDRGTTGGGGPVGLYRSELVAVVPSSGALRVVASLAELLGDPGEVAGPAAQFAPFPLRARCASDRFALYDPLRNQVRTFDGSGTQMGAVDLPTPREVEITIDALVVAAMGMAVDQAATLGFPLDSASIHAEIERALREDEELISGVFPEFVDLHCNEEGTFWIQPFDLESGRLGVGPAWLRIDRDQMMQEFHFPERFDPHRFAEDRVWGVLRDEFDVASIAWIDLTRQPPGPLP